MGVVDAMEGWVVSVVLVLVLLFLLWLLAEGQGAGVLLNGTRMRGAASAQLWRPRVRSWSADWLYSLVYPHAYVPTYLCVYKIPRAARPHALGHMHR